MNTIQKFAPLLHISARPHQRLMLALMLAGLCSVQPAIAVQNDKNVTSGQPAASTKNAQPKKAEQKNTQAKTGKAVTPAKPQTTAKASAAAKATPAAKTSNAKNSSSKTTASKPRSATAAKPASSTRAASKSASNARTAVGGRKTATASRTVQPALVANTPASSAPPAALNPTLAGLASTALRQREMYRQAMAALRAGRNDEFESLTERLTDYPLYPYLKLQDYAQHMGPVPFEDVKKFATQYQDTPAGLRMSYTWLRAQAAEGDWPMILKHYAPGQFGEEFDCIYYRAKYETGDTANAFQGAEKLWNVGYPQSSACDELFEAWKAQHPIPEKLALERIEKSYRNNKPQLAATLERYVSAERLPIVREWGDVYEDPSRINRTDRYLAWGNKAAPLLTTGLERLAQRDPVQAGQLWKIYQPQIGFAKHEQQRILFQIARFMMVNFSSDTEYWLNAALAVGASDVVPIGVRSALRAQDWERAERWLSAASDKERDQLMWQYWRARTDQWLESYYATHQLTTAATPLPVPDKYSVMGNHWRFMQALANPYRLRETFPARVKALIEDSAPPATAFELLAQNRSFYGFLASTRIGKPLAITSTHYTLEGEMRQIVRKSVALNRVLEFQALGQDDDARRELFHIVKYVPEKEKIAAALIAQQAGWYLHAILLSQQSGAQDDLNIRYPVLYTNTITQRASEAGITPDWAYAIIRQESAFWQEAKSSVGALGYMQLMPATAREVAKSIGLRLSTANEIMQPDTNIRLGTTYLGQLQRQLDGNSVLATAAYNAGAGRARKWQPRDTPMPGDIWVETIPFTETRDYVKNVMTFQAIYKHSLGKPAVLPHDMEYIPPLIRSSGYNN